jgi:hypothetical protein
VGRGRQSATTASFVHAVRLHRQTARAGSWETLSVVGVMRITSGPGSTRWHAHYFRLGSTRWHAHHFRLGSTTRWDAHHFRLGSTRWHAHHFRLGSTRWHAHHGRPARSHAASGNGACCSQCWPRAGRPHGQCFGTATVSQSERRVPLERGARRAQPARRCLSRRRSRSWSGLSESATQLRNRLQGQPVTQLRQRARTSCSLARRPGKGAVRAGQLQQSPFLLSTALRTVPGIREA